MSQQIFSRAACVTAFALSACSGSSPTLAPSRPQPTVAPTATAAPTTAPSATPTPSAAPTAQVQVIHVGFTHATESDPTFGEIAYYAPDAGNAAVVRVNTGSKVVFLNDGTNVPHTASGLGSSGFPTTFDNANGTSPFGATIDGGTTWSSGNLNPGQTSAVFTVGPPGTYYFGCAYHYPLSPSMRDVLVSS